MQEVELNPEVLPDFFKDAKIVGPAVNELPKYKALHTHLASSAKKQDCPVNVNNSPTLMSTDSVKEIYQNNNFSKIKELEDQAQSDLQPIYTNVSTKGSEAWTKVESQGKQFYMSWSENGSIWAYTQNIATTNDETGKTTYQATVQVGTYSKSSSVLGLQSYNLTLPTILVESVIAFIVARAVSSIIADGLGFLVTRFGLYLAEAAAEAGIEAFSFTVSAAALSAVATTLAFAVVFIGLMYLWNWLNRKYTIRLQIFNWDHDNPWNAAGQYMSNAKIPGGDDSSSLNFTLPKKVNAGDIITPPGFDPVIALDSVCYYAIVIWENDNTFMEGCSMALKMQRDKSSTEGFMWAFECPRWSDNNQAGKNGQEDPKTYRNNVSWNSHPLSFEITSTSDNVPISFGLNALSGASDDLYNINIHIDHSSS